MNKYRDYKLVNKFLIRLISLIFAFGISINSHSQITINNTLTPQQLVENILVGPGISVSNINYTGSSVSLGSFSNANSIFNGMDEGVILCTGNVMDAVGPNLLPNTQTNTLGPSNPLLEGLIPGYSIYDAALLEFDFIPMSDTIRFQFAFASEEYPEWVGSAYNDVFGFFVTGDNPSGGTYNNHNLAIVPGTANTSITVNNVNNGPLNNGPCNNCNYYVDNSSGMDIEYDGYTTVITTWLIVTPCTSYHILLAIGDGGDHSYDSGIFLKKNSFSSPVLEINTDYTTSTDAIEGCSNGLVKFVLENPSLNNRWINYTIGGSAINGTDYQTIPDSLLMPMGSDSVGFYITPIADGLVEGTEYVELIIKTSDCSYDTITIPIIDYDSLQVNITGNTAICLGDSTILTANITDGVTPYSQLWNNNDTNTAITVSPNSNTTYTIDVTDACNVVVQESINVSVNPIPNVSVTSVLATLCSGNSTQLTANGANNYQWSPSGSLSSNTGAIVTATPNSTTNYQVIGTDVNGCKDTTTVNVNVLPLPNLNVNVVSPQICFGQSTNINASGAVSYLWSPASSLNTSTGNIVVATPNATTTYKVIGTGANGCTDSLNAIVNINPIPNIQINPPNVDLCIGQSTTLTASGGNTYNWSPSTNLSSTNTAITTANPIATITYTVNGTSAAGCSSSASVVVTTHAPPIIAATPSPVTICNGNNTVLTVNGANTYQWSPSASLSSGTGNNVTANPIINTNYQVIGSDNNGCTDTTNVLVNVNEVTINLNSNFNICIGDNVNITANTNPGTATLVWSNGSTSNTINVSPIVTTTYTVTATGPTGCTDINSTVVHVNPLPTININPINSQICVGNSINVTANGASSYTWLPIANNSNPNSASTSLSPMVNTVYTVSGTDNNGCTNTANTTITVNPLPNVSVLPIQDSICIGTTTTLTANGAVSYTWAPSGSLSSNAGISVIASPTAASTSYIVTGTDANGCINTDTAVVDVSPVISASAANPNICEDDSSLVSVSSNVPSTYLWSNGVTTNSFYADPAITTTYYVTVTAYNGCTNNDSALVRILPQPPVVITPNNASICMGTSQSLTASGAATYAWQANPNLSALTGATVIASPMANDSYMVIGTDANGCIDTAYANITILDTNTIKITPISSTFCVYDSIQFTSTVTGTPTISWEPNSIINPNTGGSIYANPIVAGSYTIIATATSANGCTDTAMAHIIANPKPALTINTDTSHICIGKSTTLTANGANSYQWSPAAGLSNTNTNSTVANPIINTTYQVIGTSLGCTDTLTSFVGVHNYPTINVNAVPAQICPNDSATITAVGASTYIWSPNNGLSSNTGNIVKASPDSTQLYTVIGSNQWACTDTATANIIVSPIPVITGTPSICDGQTATLNVVSNLGGTTFLWSTGSTATTINVSPAITTIYTVTATDGGCTKDTNFTVVVNGIPSLSVSPNDTTICHGNQVSLVASGANTYLWVPNNTLSDSTTSTVVASPSSNTTYSIIGTTIHGCKDTIQSTVNLFPIINVSVTPDSSYSCGSGNQVLTASGANTYSWSPSSGLSSTTGAIVTAGPTNNIIYTVIGTDTNSCIDSAIAHMCIFGPANITPVNPYICLGDSVKLTANTENIPDSYLWNTGDTTKSIWVSPTSNFVYSVTVNYPGGCVRNSSDSVFIHTDTSVTASTTTPFVCAGDTAILQASGNASYTWTGPNLVSNTGDSVRATPNGPSQYIVKGISAAHSCKTYDTLLIQLHPLANITISTPTNPICERDTAQLTGLGGVSYIWSPNYRIDTTHGTIVNVAPFSDMRYFVSGTDANGCSDTSSILIQHIPIPTISIAPDSPFVCQYDTIELYASGSVGGYNWWPNFQCNGVNNDTLEIFPLANITYNVRGFGANGCHHDTFIYVNVKRTPLLGITPIFDSICSGDSINITAWGAATYKWSPYNSLSDSTGSSVNASPGAQTTYTVVGTSTDGCDLTLSSTIKVNPNPVVNLSPANALICENDSITLTSSGGINYQWTPNFNIILNANSDTCIAFPHVDTTYKVIGFNTFGCRDSAYSVITTKPTPNIVAIPDNPAICYGDSVNITASGAQTYNWSPNYSINTNTGSSVWLSPLTDTSYIVKGTDSQNCWNTDTVDVIVHPEIILTINPIADSICIGESINITAGGGVNYLWSPAASLSTNNTATVTASPTANQIYKAKVYDIFGCVDSIYSDIRVLSLPNVVINPNPTSICHGDTALLTVSGANTYNWSPNSAINTLIGDSVFVNPIIPTSYIAKGTDIYGCINYDTSLVSIWALPNVELSANDTTLCYGESTMLYANGASIYNWWPNNSLSGIIGDSNMTTTLDTIMYFIEGTDANQCKNSDSLEIIVFPLPILALSSTDSLFCANSQVILSATSFLATTIINWDDGSIGNTAIDNPSNDTTYTIIGENIYGCFDSISLFIQANQFPILNLSTTDTIICYNDSATIISGSSLPNLSYLWSTGEITPNITVNPLTLSSYTLIATDSIGCSDTINTIVKVQPIVPLNISSNNTHICEGDTLNLSANTGFPVVSYLWNDGCTLNPKQASPEQDTTYSVVVTDSIGCINSDTIDILVNPIPTITTNATPYTICIGDTSTLFATSNISPLSYQWSTNATTQTIEVNPSVTSTYSVSGTDSIGCTSSTNVTINVNNLPIININPNPAKICNGDNITLSINSNISLTQYLWSNSSSTSTILVSPHTTTNYSVSVTDINGCKNNTQSDVTVYDLPTISISPQTDTICTDDSIQLQLSYNHIMQSILWNNGATVNNPYVSPMTNQTFSAIYTDTNGCKAYDSSYIHVILRPTCTLLAESPICTNDSSKIEYFGNASLNASTNWDFGSATVLSGIGISTHYLQWNIAGTHIVTLDVTENGCTSYPDTAEIIVHTSPIPQIFVLDTNSCDSIPVDFEGLPNGMSSYHWEFGDPLAMGNDTSDLQDPTYIYLSPGSYSVSLLVVSQDGCPALTIKNSMLNVWPRPSADFIANPPVSHDNSPTINFIDKSIGAVQWQWDFGDPISGSFNNSTGKYPYHIYQQTGLFFVEQVVISDHGCTDTIMRTVEIDNGPTFYVPTAFSPNGDGLNEVFLPLGTDFKEESYEIIIFERWGSKVFESKSYANPWDGTHYKTGEELSTSVFSYIIRYVDKFNQKRVLTGVVTILR